MNEGPGNITEMRLLLLGFALLSRGTRRDPIRVRHTGNSPAFRIVRRARPWSGDRRLTGGSSRICCLLLTGRRLALTASLRLRNPRLRLGGGRFCAEALPMRTAALASAMMNFILRFLLSDSRPPCVNAKG